ncbi:AfsR/SARP family transcriptional regulator [Amycolatopsis eburnea]|uniref:AfsR/SARP family transcriptional regulator n=1 Tax=Amycolatopsis eburnea TaxID=2267691 RepID=UPI001315AA5E|nr:AfsR/SARP family transcriptional regulator [Amycolatopsis eburnea]
MLQFKLLGPLCVLSDERDITPSAPKLREILALLIVRANQFVSTTDLVDEVWGADPPRSAQVTVQTYIHRLRKSLFPRESGHEPAGLHTGWHGYRLEIAAEAVDKIQFEQMAQRGSVALEEGDPAEATELLRHALRLWRGPAMSDVETGELLSAYAVRLEEGRLRALEGRVEADLQLGRHRGLVSELKELTMTQPLHEGFHGQLMLALHRCQRRDEALDVYRRFRGRLVEELALEPSPDLQRLHRSLLTAETEPRPAPEVPAERVQVDAPAQLPNDIADFTGRTELLGSAVRWLSPAERTDEGLRIVSVMGMPGVGKSAFAVRVAHRLRPAFGDGQFYARFGPADAGPKEVLGQFLRAIGVPPERLPDSVEERATMFRSWSVDRNVLVVLDDVTSDADVQPLLPAGPRCAVVATACSGLQGLAGTHTIDLEPLTAGESFEMLSVIVGRERIAAERDDALGLVGLCGHLPLAVRCLGARLRSVPGWPVRNMRRHLESSTRPLDLLQFNRLDVRSRLAGSYRTVPAPAQSAFRLLPTLGTGPFSAEDAAPRLDCSPKRAEALLARLVGHGLLRIRPDGAGGGPVRFEFHPITRCYAEELLAKDNPAPHLWPGYVREVLEVREEG